MNTYGDWTRWLDNTPEQFVSLQQLMRTHRCTLVQVPYRQAGNLPSPFLAPKFDVTDLDQPRIDWSRFDAELGGLFDGSAFDDGQPVSHFILPLAYNTPVRFLEYQRDPQGYIAAQIGLRRAIAEHLRDKGWTETIFQEFHNENIENGAVTSPWYLDEPRTPQDLKGHELFLDIFERAMADAGPGIRPHYRIDISWWQRLGDAFHEIAPRFDDWVVSRDRNFLDAQAAAMFRKLADARRGMLLEYGEMMGFSKEGQAVAWSHLAEYPRNCWTYGLDGFEQWIVDMWAAPAGEKKMNAGKALFHSSGGGMRDWIWPGNALGIVGPMPSLRLKALRECLYLFDYASMAAAESDEVAQQVKAMLEAMKLDTATDLYRTRNQLSNMLGAVT
jgi:hypothetical protein